MVAPTVPAYCWHSKYQRQKVGATHMAPIMVRRPLNGFALQHVKKVGVCPYDHSQSCVQNMNKCFYTPLFILLLPVLLGWLPGVVDGRAQRLIGDPILRWCRSSSVRPEYWGLPECGPLVPKDSCREILYWKNKGSYSHIRPLIVRRHLSGRPSVFENSCCHSAY